MKKVIRQFRPSKFWSNVTALRTDAGISERDLSILIGMKDTYVNKAILHGGTPNIAVVLAIAEIFGTTVEDLAFGAIGLQIRQRQLEAELAKIKEEIADAEADVARLSDE